MSLKTVVVLFLCSVLVYPAGAAEAIYHDSGGGLKILTLSGAGAVNSISSRKVTAPIVEVRDNTNRPVENARVVFELPATGAGATFPKNQFIHETFTDPRGQAAAPEFQINQAGSFKIAVKAYAGDRTGSAEIRQTNSFKEAPPEKLSSGGGLSKKWLILGAVGAGVAVAAILAAGGGEAAAAAAIPPIGVNTGPITVGAPR
jgi:hypothetical protein